MKKIISFSLALILVLTVLVVPAAAEKTVKVGELIYLNSDGTARSEMLFEALKAIQEYSGGFQIFGGVYELNTEANEVSVDNVEPVDAVEAVEFDNLNSMQLALESGMIDEMIVYYTVGQYLCRENENLTSWLDFSALEEILAEMPVKNRFILDQVMGTDFCFLMLEDQTALRDEFNQAIADMKADGTLDALKAGIMDLDSSVNAEKIDGAETIRVAVTGDLPPMDYIDESGTPAGFNTAIIAEISKRIGKNIELVSIDAGARSTALGSGIVDVVFWSRISTPDDSIFEIVPEKRKGEAMIISLAVSPLRHPTIDIPEGTICTDAYFHDMYIMISLK